MSVSDVLSVAKDVRRWLAAGLQGVVVELGAGVEQAHAGVDRLADVVLGVLDLARGRDDLVEALLRDDDDAVEVTGR